MSDELNKEMDELEEVEEATAEPTGVKAKEPGATSPKSVKLKQEKENMAKEKGAKSKYIVRASNLKEENLINVTIYEFDKNNNFTRRVEADSANITSLKWV